MAERPQPLADHKYIVKGDLPGVGYSAGDLAALAGGYRGRRGAGEDLEGKCHAVDPDCRRMRLDFMRRVLSQGLKFNAAIAVDRGLGFDHPELARQEIA